MLYKYLPLVHATSMLERGEVLTRSLSYFRAVEHRARGDQIEGMHVDAPNNDVTLTSNTGIRSVGRYRFLRSVRQDRVFAFCCSTEYDARLFESFEADACVVIRDEAEFFERLRKAIKRTGVAVKPYLRHGRVAYFDPAAEAPIDVTKAKNLPFLKHQAFEEQREYRAVYAGRGAYKVLMRIVQPAFTLESEVRMAKKHQRILRLGSLVDIAEIAPKPSLDRADV